MGLNSNKNYSLFILTLLILSLISIFWLYAKGVTSGRIFFGVILVCIIAWVLIGIFFREQSAPISEPFQDKFSSSTVSFSLGFMVPLLLLLVGGIVTANSFIPLSANKIISETTSQSFSTVEAESSPVYRLLVITQFAPTVEEFTFGFTILYLLYLYFLQMFNRNKALATVPAILVSSALFSLTHFLNGDYVNNPSAFIIAFFFRAIMNTIILFNPAISLAGIIGFHFSNNLIYYIRALGWSETLIGMTSILGGIFFLFILVTFLIAIFQIVTGNVKWKDFIYFRAPS